MPRLILILFALLFYFYAQIILATEIKQVQINRYDNYYELSADIDYQLSNPAKKALENGVPLFWNLHIKVLEQRDYWWAKKIADIQIHYRLQYHALLNMYRVVIIQPNNEFKTYNFSTLSAALDLMSNLQHLTLINAEQLNSNKHYIVKIKAEFDTDALPLPLRPIAYTHPQWYLSSDWTTWQLKK